ALISQEKKGLLIPARALFAAVREEDESKAVRNELSQWIPEGSEEIFKALDRANEIRTKVLSSTILAYEIDTDADDENVIEIFARLNTQGVRLRAGDIAAARLTGTMKKFRDRARKSLASSSFKGFTAKDNDNGKGGGIDIDLLIKTAIFNACGTIRFKDI